MKTPPRATSAADGPEHLLNVGPRVDTSLDSKLLENDASDDATQSEFVAVLPDEPDEKQMKRDKAGVDVNGRSIEFLFPYLVWRRTWSINSPGWMDETLGRITANNTGIGPEDNTTIPEDDAAVPGDNVSVVEDFIAAKEDKIASRTNSVPGCGTASENIPALEESTTEPEYTEPQNHTTAPPEDKTTALHENTIAAEGGANVPEGGTATTATPADASSLSQRLSNDIHAGLAKDQAGPSPDEQSKRMEELEERLRASEAQREGLEEQVADLRGKWSETVSRYDTMRENRNKDTAKHLDRMKDRDREEDRLRARVELLEDELVQARGAGANDPAPAPTTTTGAKDEDEGEGEDVRGLRRLCAQAVRREAGLLKDLELERDRSRRLEQHLQQQVGALTAELTKTRDALADSQKNHLEARSEVNRLHLRRFSSAAQFMGYYGRLLLDPHSRLYETMVAIAGYRDGTGPAPTAEQRAGLRLFRDYLEERAEVLREAMEMDDPRPVLRAFDDKWGAETVRSDWGAMIALRLSATRAATALGFTTDEEGAGGAGIIDGAQSRADGRGLRAAA